MQEHKPSIDIRRPDGDSPGREDRRKSLQFKRAHSKRVKFETDEVKKAAREERLRVQREAKLRKMQEARQNKLAETLKKAEAQMQNTFVAKIFRNQQDLRKLDNLSSAEEQAKKRAEFRMKQLKQLEERKLDCRVTPSFFTLIAFEQQHRDNNSFICNTLCTHSLYVNFSLTSWLRSTIHIIVIAS